jgi:RNA polymerase sigma-70 factor (ECF subfamily)
VKSDEEIIACYRVSGQHELLEELADRYLGKVRAMIYPMVLDRAWADDLTQEVFLRAFRGLAGFNGRAQFSTWLYRVTMNTVHSFLARRRRSPVAYCAEVPDCAESSAAPPESAVMQAELECAVESSLRGLPPKLRAAIVLTTLEKIEVGEAARIEGCSRATMYWRIHEARKRLKGRLERYFSQWR